MSVIRKRKKREFDDRTYPDIMVDLETLGTEPDTQIISIGAVRFRLDTRDDVESILGEGRSFYARLDTEEQSAKGRSTTADTLEWWESQSDEARAVFEEEPEGVLLALKRFLRFCKGGRRLWGNGNMFDNTIIRDILKSYDLDHPVYFSNDLDVRTLKRLWNLIKHKGSNIDRPTIKMGEEHNALDDARRQVLQCQTMFSELKGSKYNEHI